MLNQKYFNGVGNYLRAEVLYRAGVPPFVKARDVLQPLVKDEGGNGKVKAGKKEKAENDLLLLCNVVMREVMDLSANPYVEPGMDSTAGVRARHLHEVNFRNALLLRSLLNHDEVVILK